MMTSQTNFSVRSASWQEDKEQLMRIRHQVFVLEQQVPIELESDSYDQSSWYVLAESSDAEPIACARLQKNGKVTRIAVLKNWRRQGVARAMLTRLIETAAQHQIEPLYLHAQLSAISLYLEFGFTQTGEQFEEAGITHIKMTRHANDQSLGHS